MIDDAFEFYNLLSVYIFAACRPFELTEGVTKPVINELLYFFHPAVQSGFQSFFL